MVMNLRGAWFGLTGSGLLAGYSPRERDPARALVAAGGGVLVGLAAALAGLILVLTLYVLLSGEAGRGLAGLGDAAKALSDDHLTGPGPALARLLVTLVGDGAFLAGWAAFAAAVAQRPLHDYVSLAMAVRWRLLFLALALTLLAMSPLVVLERLVAPATPELPVVQGGGNIGSHVIYALSSLLLIPAAAIEEVFFRGWLLRQTGAFMRKPHLLILVNAVLFAAMHMDFAPDAFLNRALMGGALTYMTLRLGGIEMACGAHAMNNMLIVLFLQPLSFDRALDADLSALPILEDAVLVASFVAMTEAVARSPLLRRLGGVSAAEISPGGRSALTDA